MRIQNHPEPILLVCPDCSERNTYDEADLTAGLPVVCPHCGVELMVTHDRDTADGPPVWRLELPQEADEAGVRS